MVLKVLLFAFSVCLSQGRPSDFPYQVQYPAFYPHTYQPFNYVPVFPTNLAPVSASGPSVRTDVVSVTGTGQNEVRTPLSATEYQPYVIPFTPHAASPVFAVAHNNPRLRQNFVLANNPNVQHQFVVPITQRVRHNFHSQDGKGGYSFGYQGDTSSRHETRDHFGVIRGAVNHIDAEGKLQSQQYIADASGFRVFGTNLPVAPVDTAVPVEDTLEVREAKKAHLELLASKRSPIPETSDGVKSRTKRQTPFYYSTTEVDHRVPSFTYTSSKVPANTYRTIIPTTRNIIVPPHVPVFNAAFRPNKVETRNEHVVSNYRLGTPIYQVPNFPTVDSAFTPGTGQIFRSVPVYTDGVKRNEIPYSPTFYSAFNPGKYQVRGNVPAHTQILTHHPSYAVTRNFAVDFDSYEEK